MIVSMCIVFNGKRPERGYLFVWNPAVYGQRFINTLFIIFGTGLLLSIIQTADLKIDRNKDSCVTQIRLCTFVMLHV